MVTAIHLLPTLYIHGMLQDMLYLYLRGKESRGSVVGIVTRLWSRQPGNRGSIPERGKKFPSFRNVQDDSRTNQDCYPRSSNSSFPGVKRSRRETDHSAPPITEVKNV
jgi:hypothetical protein